MWPDMKKIFFAVAIMAMTTGLMAQEKDLFKFDMLEIDTIGKAQIVERSPGLFALKIQDVDGKKWVKAFETRKAAILADFFELYTHVDPAGKVPAILRLGVNQSRVATGDGSYFLTDRVMFEFINCKGRL